MAISYLSALDIDSGITTASSSTLAGATFTSGLAMGSNDITLTGNIGRDGHNYITFATDDQVVIRVADSHRIKLNSAGLLPYTDSAYDLGTTALRFANLWVDSINGSTPTTGTVTSVGFTHAGDAFTVGGQPVTSSGTIAITMAGTSSQFIDGAGTLTNLSTLPQGDITSVVAGSGLTGGGTSGAVTLNVGAGALIDVDADAILVDLTELTDMTQAWDTSADEFVVLDGGSSQKRKLSSEIFGSNAFNSSTIYAEPGIFSGGGTPTLASGVTAAEVRTLIGAGTSSTSGTVTSITAGTGLDGGTITGSGTIDLADTAVTPGSYTSAAITVDQQGRISAASSGSPGDITAVTASTNNSYLGITVATSTGPVPDVGINLAGLTALATPADEDILLIYDEGVPQNKKITVANLLASVPQGDLTGLTAGTGITITSPTGPVPTINCSITNNNQLTNGAGYTTYAEPGIFSGGGTPTLASGVTAAEVRSLIGAGTSSTSGTVTSVTVSAGSGLGGGGTVTTSGTITLTADVTASSSTTFTNKGGNISQWTNDSGYTSNSGDITGVTAGSGMSGGGTSGTVTLTNAGVTSIVAGSNISISGATGAVTVTATDTNTTYSAGTALDLSGTTFNVDLSELSTSTTNGDGDYFVVTDTSSVQRKLTKGNIALSGMNNDSGWTTNTGTTTASNSQTFTNKGGNISQWTNDSGYTSNSGDITGVTAGTGMSGGGTSGTVTLNCSITNNNQLTNGSGYTTNTGTTTASNSQTFTNKGGNISQWTNDSGYTTSSGDITAVNAGTGISGGGTSGSVTITNSGVTSIVAGTGIDVSGATGAVTVSTEQDIDTGADVRFDSFGVGTNASGTTGMIRATNNIYAYYSDERLKDFEGKIPNALDKVCQLGGYYFRENELAKELGYDDDKRQVGVSAQEVEKIMPEVVHVAPISDTEAANGVEYKTVSYDKLVPLLIESIKELKAEIDELKKS